MSYVFVLQTSQRYAKNFLKYISFKEEKIIQNLWILPMEQCPLAWDFSIQKAGYF